MRRTKEEAAITRDHLLQAAQVCFLAHGYTATRLEDVARQAGISRGAIQWHFGNKVDLYNALIADRYERASARMRQDLSPSSSPLQTLRQLMIWWMRYPAQDTDFRAVLELKLLKTEVGPELAQGMQENERGIEHSLEWFSGLVRQGIAAGEIRGEVNPDVAARALLGLLNGLTEMWILNPAAFSLSDGAEVTADLFLRSLQ